MFFHRISNVLSTPPHARASDTVVATSEPATTVTSRTVAIMIFRTNITHFATSEISKATRAEFFIVYERSNKNKCHKNHAVQYYEPINSEQTINNYIPVINICVSWILALILYYSYSLTQYFSIILIIKDSVQYFVKITRNHSTDIDKFLFLQSIIIYVQLIIQFNIQFIN